MRYTVLGAGVPLGSIHLSSAERTITPLEVAPGYAQSPARTVARALGIAFHALDWSGRLAPLVRTRALATAFARAHAIQNTLTLTDERGMQQPVARVLVIEFPRDPVPVVVVNVRDVPAGLGAELIIPPGSEAGARRTND